MLVLEGRADVFIFVGTVGGKMEAVFLLIVLCLVEVWDGGFWCLVILSFKVFFDD